MTSRSNAHEETVAGFGDEWKRFDQSSLSVAERQEIFDQYFAIFPKDTLNPRACGADFGVGSGRWASIISPKVGRLICIDASGEALEVARINLTGFDNCQFHHSTINAIEIEDSSLDFGYSLGVLHHIPDTAGAMQVCVNKLKPGAPFLVYLYYRFDNKPPWYRWLWLCSESGRRVISRMPHSLRYVASQVVATLVYWPLARFARLAERFGLNADNFPLTYYRSRSFYTMRTDALDRFGTQLEQRFTRAEIRKMMEDCGLEEIIFSDDFPYWCAMGRKKEK